MTDPRLDAWLAAEVDDLDHAVARQLDIEAGLRDAQLLHRLHTLDTGLHEVLDVDAGLLAITGPQEVRPDSCPTAGQVENVSLSELPLQVRLQLRPLLTRDATLNRLYEDARDSAFFHSLSNDATTLLQLISGQDTTKPVLSGDHTERVINNLCAFGLSLSYEVDNFAGKFAVHRIDASPLSVSFSTALNDRSLPLEVMTYLTQLRRTAETIANVVELVLSGVRKINQPGLIDNLARDIDAFIDRFDGFILRIGKLHEESIQSFYNTASYLAHRTAGSTIDATVAQILTALEDGIRHADIHGVHLLGEELVRLLSDFTSEDLTDVELAGAELRGVRWSLTNTRWPAGWQQPMLEASAPVVSGRKPDLYEVRDDPRVHDVVR